jgi:uncharacterized YccA/Bax inhibitor family protein
MGVTLVVAVACALLAYRRGRSWWKWALIAVAMDIVIALALLAVAGAASIQLRAPGTVNEIAAWVVVVLPRLATLVTVYALTRSSRAAGAPRAAARRA